VRKSKLLILALAFVMILALVLTGCNGDDDATPGNDNGNDVGNDRSGGIFRMHISNPVYLDPYNAFETQGLTVVSALFDALVIPDFLEPSILHPGAALSWDINDEATQFTFYLDPDGMFADGTPVTAEHFVFAFNRIADPNAVGTKSLDDDEDASLLFSQLDAVEGFAEFRAGDADGLSGLVIVDDHTLEINLSRPFGDFIFNLAHKAFVPVQERHILEGVEFNGEMVPFGLMPIGNGPFMMAEPWDDHVSINVVRNPYYSGPAPYIDGIFFNIFGDAAAAFTAFEAGDLDYAEIVPGRLTQMKEDFGTAGNNGYVANPGEQVIYGLQSGTYFLILNMEDGATADPEFRRAINLAINREAINASVWEDGFEVATDILPPDIPGYLTGAWADSRFDRDAAIEALEASSFDVDNDVVPLVYNTGSFHSEVMALVQADLNAIGIQTTLEGMDWTVYNEMLADGNFEIARRGWMTSYPSTHYWLFELFGTGVGNNETFYSNAEVDALMEKASATADADARAALYAEANQLIQADNPMVPVAYYAHRAIVSDRMNNVIAGPLNFIDFGSMWIAAD